MSKQLSAADAISRILCKSIKNMSVEEILAYSEFQNCWNNLPQSLKLTLHSSLESYLNVN